MSLGLDLWQMTKQEMDEATKRFKEKQALIDAKDLMEKCKPAVKVAKTALKRVKKETNK